MISPLEQFAIGNIFEIFLLTNSNFIDISFSNLSFFIFLVIFFFIILFYLIYNKNNEKVLKNPTQSFLENITFFILNLLKENLSLSNVVYFTFLFSIFIFILFSNVIGIFPYTFTVTGHLVITFGIAFFVFLGLNIIGYKKHYSFLLSLLLPDGVPFVISPLLIIIEFISYNFRVISLSVRLFANIMAGHTLLAVIFSFNRFLLQIKTNSIFFSVLVLFIIIPAIILVILLIGLEFGVALIQAYVFTLLCTMYLYDTKFLH